MTHTELGGLRRGEPAADLDARAAALLRRFRERGDVAAFRDLAKLTHGPLVERAFRATRALGVAAPPDELVAELFTALFTDLEPASGRAVPFLADATARLVALARDRLRRAHGTPFAAAFHALPVRERRLLLLRDVDGLDYAAIAREIGIPQGRVARALVTARRRLAEAAGASRGMPA